MRGCSPPGCGATPSVRRTCATPTASEGEVITRWSMCARGIPDASSTAHDLRRDAQPASLAPRPDVGVAAGTRLAALGVDRATVDDRDLAQDANAHVFRLQIRD